MMEAALTRQDAAHTLGGAEQQGQALTFCPSAVAAASVRSWSAELEEEDDDDEVEAVALSPSDTGVVSSVVVVTSASDSSETDEEQLLTSGEGNPHESRSSK
jgi:hypothetical protein